MKVRNTVALVAAACVLCACKSTPPVNQTQNSEPVAATPAALDLDALLIRKDHIQTLEAGVPIQIDNPYGDVRLRFGGYAHAVEIHVTEQRPDSTHPAFDYLHQLEGGVYRIAPQLPMGTTLAPTQRTDLVVFVPQGHAVSVSTARGLIESRGLKSALSVRSEAGNIMARGTEGLLDLQTAEGSIEVSLENAPAGSQQKLVTTTGSITAAMADSTNVAIDLATSAPMSTEFSLQIEHLAGQEPNKRAQAVVGQGDAQLQIESKRGEIRLLRRAAFTPVASSQE